MKFVVAFSSPKRSAKTVATAARHARALDAELVILRIVPDPSKVGVIAQLISSGRPEDKARQQVDRVVEKLRAEGLKASGIVKVGEVASDIVQTTKELGADMLFLGTSSCGRSGFFMTKTDPVVRYLVDNAPVTICMVRNDGDGPAYNEVDPGDQDDIDDIADDGESAAGEPVADQENSEDSEKSG